MKDNHTKEELLAEIEKLEKEICTLKCTVSIYQSVLASIRDTAKKYVPEISNTLGNYSSSVNM